jgi:hypothetical protein
MNLVLVDRVVFHPILGGLVVAGVICVLCYLQVCHYWRRVVVIVAVTDGAFAWTLGWLALASLSPTESQGAAATSATSAIWTRNAGRSAPAWGLHVLSVQV